jgi:hypothetical protein
MPVPKHFNGTASPTDGSRKGGGIRRVSYFIFSIFLIPFFSYTIPGPFEMLTVTPQLNNKDLRVPSVTTNVNSPLLCPSIQKHYTPSPRRHPRSWQWWQRRAWDGGHIMPSCESVGESSTTCDVGSELFEGGRRPSRVLTGCL